MVEEIFVESPMPNASREQREKSSGDDVSIFQHCVMKAMCCHRMSLKKFGVLDNCVSPSREIKTTLTSMPDGSIHSM
jgi:hypothetical protein